MTDQKDLGRAKGVSEAQWHVYFPAHRSGNRHLTCSALALSIVLVISTIGCSKTYQVTPPDRKPNSDTRTELAEAEVLSFPPTPKPPLKVVVLVDFSASTDEHRIRRPQPKDLEPLVEALVKHGGVLAIAAVCNDSNLPLVRMAFPEPPGFDESLLHNATPPGPLDERSINPMALPEAKRLEQEAWADYQQRQAEDKALLESHSAAVEAQQANSRAQGKAFLEEIAPLLDRSANCTKTDLYGALQRADLLFSEDNSLWSQTPNAYLLVSSDGIHDSPTPAVQLQSNPEIFLINGSGSTGIFSALNHQAFEALEPAIDSVLNHVGSPSHDNE